MKKFLTLSMLTALVLIGCNKAAAPTTDTAPAADATAKTEASTAPATPAADEVVADAPKGCPNKSTVAVKSDDIDTTISAANSWYIENSPDWGTFFFTNYTLDPKSPWGHTYAGKDAKASFSVSTKDKTPVANGVWDQALADANNKLTEIGIAGVSANRGIIGSKNKVEITYFGSDYVCGNVAIDDGYGSVKGDFIAKYSKFSN